MTAQMLFSLRGMHHYIMGKRSLNLPQRAGLAYAETGGDEEAVSKILGLTMEKTRRLLSDPDALGILEKSLKTTDDVKYWGLDPDARMGFLSVGAVSGSLPRMKFIHTSNGIEPTGEVELEPISNDLRLRCIDMLNKMTGTYNVNVNIRAKQAIQVITGIDRDPNEPVIDITPEEDPLDL
jgi:hypothetical protein